MRYSNWRTRDQVPPQALIHNILKQMHQGSRTISSNNKTVRLLYNQDNITFELEDPERLERYTGSYSYETLPMEFRVIFENLQEIYTFVATETENKIRIENKVMFVLVNIIGKIKEFQLPLEEVEPTGELKLRRDIRALELNLSEKNKETALLLEALKQRENTIEELRKSLALLSGTMKERESENMKLVNRIRHLENNLDDLLNEKSKSSENNLQESRLTEEYTPVKRSYFGSKSKKVKELEEYGKKISFKIDESAKHFNKFRTCLNEVQKLHGPTYQLFHHEPIPKEGRYYFDIKIILIKNNNIVVGVVTDKNKEEQFSFKKNNCVCYNGYDGSICEQEKQSYVTIKPKEGNKLRTVVDMSMGQVEWFIMGGDMIKTLIGRANIPNCMTKQSLYPYFQLYWQGNKIKLNA